MALVISCGAATGLCLLAFSARLDTPMAAIAIVLIGIGLGAEIDVLSFLIARYFGISAFSTIYGIAVFAIAIVAAAMASALGLTFDRFGSYDPALMMIAGCLIASGLLYLTLGRYPEKAMVAEGGFD